MKKSAGITTPKLTLPKHALLVVDMDVGQPMKGPPGPSPEDLRPLRSVISVAKGLEMPIFFFARGILEVRKDRFPSEFLKAAGSKARFVLKHNFDAFDSTGLSEVLKTEGITNLVISGFDSAYCVYQTSRSAKEKGYETITTEDILFTVRERGRFFNLTTMKKECYPRYDTQLEYYQYECTNFFSSAQELNTELVGRAKSA
ncbi:Isochorismatase family protein [uncultured archaeon]|nr:Isochorismatase family protein [uncultured archaeon]